ncbi:MAG: hypothetical protein ACRDZR_06475 [Acidimicrobiales bacterium]
MDDPWRDALRRPVLGTLLLALVFVVSTAPIKETPALFDHAPWLNDPFGPLRLCRSSATSAVSNQGC